MALLSLDDLAFSVLAKHLGPTPLVSLGLTCRALHKRVADTVRPHALLLRQRLAMQQLATGSLHTMRLQGVVKRPVTCTT